MTGRGVGFHDRRSQRRFAVRIGGDAVTEIGIHCVERRVDDECELGGTNVRHSNTVAVGIEAARDAARFGGCDADKAFARFDQWTAAQRNHCQRRPAVVSQRA